MNFEVFHRYVASSFWRSIENARGSERGVSHSAAGPQPQFATEHVRAPSPARALRLETSRAPVAKNRDAPGGHQALAGWR